MNDLDLLFDAPPSREPLRVACVGAHPDDPETGCGGTIARLTAASHNVTIVYLTRGEAGVKHLPKNAITWNPCDEKQAVAGVRSAEAETACKLLGARMIFSDQPDGDTKAGSKESGEFNALLEGLNPDLVLTHWPVDTHRDHRSASLLAYQAWHSSGQRFKLACYEVMTGIQTQEFRPNWYVDISETTSTKRAACFAHTSQKPLRFYRYHRKLEVERGVEAGLRRAEAFSVVGVGARALFRLSI